jgi:hypothetical protein
MTLVESARSWHARRMQAGARRRRLYIVHSRAFRWISWIHQGANGRVMRVITRLRIGRALQTRMASQTHLVFAASCQATQQGTCIRGILCHASELMLLRGAGRALLDPQSCLAGRRAPWLEGLPSELGVLTQAPPTRAKGTPVRSLKAFLSGVTLASGLKCARWRRAIVS